MSFCSLLCVRRLSTTSVSRAEEWSKVRMGRMVLFNARHQRIHKKELSNPAIKAKKYPDIPWHTYGCREPGVRHEGRWEHIPEMGPDVIVPKDLDQCKLKPYVTYRTKEIHQDELTAKVRNVSTCVVNNNNKNI